MINEQKSEPIVAPSAGLLSFLLPADQCQDEDLRPCRCEVLDSAGGSQKYPVPSSFLLPLL